MPAIRCLRQAGRHQDVDTRSRIRRSTTREVTTLPSYGRSGEVSHLVLTRALTPAGDTQCLTSESGRGW
jgi:hypothetical protein